MTGLHKGAAALAAIVALAGCGKPFDYDTATPEEQQVWLEDVSQGIYDGINKTLPKGRDGVYMRMGERKVDPKHRRVDIVVNVTFPGETPSFGSAMSSRTVLKGVCPAAYLGTPLERNGVKIYTRFALEGGGTMVAALLTPQTCAPFAEA